MKKYIYYPNFEPPSDSWLKFSILYLDRFETIVPYTKQHLLSDNFNQIINETDLIELFSPDYRQGERASIKAIEEVERILERPYRMSLLFDKVNVIRDWRNDASWNYTIYEEKFSYPWSEFCLSNGIGHRTNEGLLLPEELAFIYMTYLAKEISYDRDASIITDNIKFDNYTSYRKVESSNNRVKNNFAKGILDLLVPKNISEINFSTLINFRNKHRDKIAAFNSQLDSMSDKIGNGLTEQQFINGFNDIYSDMKKEILLLGIGLTAIPFAAYMLIHNIETTPNEYIKESLEALGLSFGGIFSIRKAMIDTRERRLCKKYLANLQNL